jgi:ethanolamine utilization microcompartment shell protein EutS
VSVVSCVTCDSSVVVDGTVGVSNVPSGVSDVTVGVSEVTVCVSDVASGVSDVTVGLSDVTVGVSGVTSGVSVVFPCLPTGSILITFILQHSKKKSRF